MVRVSFTDEYPWHVTDDAVLVPLDVGRWAVITGGQSDLRRRLAADLRALSHRPATARHPGDPHTSHAA